MRGLVATAAIGRGLVAVPPWLPVRGAGAPGWVACRRGVVVAAAAVRRPGEG